MHFETRNGLDGLVIPQKQPLVLHSGLESGYAKENNVIDPNMVLKVRGTNVLLVDDSADARALIERYIRFSGGKVDFAENGLEGIKKALVYNYDIILMDIQMPRLDGLEAVRKLRDWGYDGSIVAVTGHSKKAEREDCLEAGFDDYLTKPINRVRLIYTVARQPRIFEKPIARQIVH